MKKAQISLFMILGIIILGVFSFTYYVISAVNEQTITQQRTTTVMQQFRDDTIDFAATVCVQDALDTGTKILLSQGFSLMPDQLGYLGEIDSASFLDNQVAYSIKNNAVVPYYPCINAERCEFTPGQASFGSSVLPPLQLGLFSVKSQIERYMNEYVQECTNLTDALFILGFYRDEVNISNIRTTVTFTQSGIKTESNFGLTAGNFYKTFKMRAENKAPILKIHNLMSDIINKDRDYIDYDPNNISIFFMGRINLISQYPLVKLKLHDLYEYDIIELNDTTNYIAGENVVAYSARQNRPPVLYYINYHPNPDYDVLVIEPLRLNITAKDPDEDSVTIKEDTTQINSLYFDAQDIGYLNKIVYASDGLLEDFQTVRVLRDEPITLSLEIKNAYENVSDNYISTQDPFMVNFSTSRSLDPHATYNYSLIYFMSDGFGNILQSEEISTNESCFMMPGLSACGKPFEMEGLFNSTGNAGIIARYRINYNNISQDTNVTAQIEVKECLPNVCCIGDSPEEWSIASNEILCEQSDSTDIKCVEGILYHLASKRYCDGKTSNKCLGVQQEDWIKTQVCGYRNESSCSNVDPYCQGVEPYTLTSGGFCKGCMVYCGGAFDEIVDMDNSGTLTQGDECGCDQNTLNKACDENFDGDFEGVCSSALGIYYCDS